MSDQSNVITDKVLRICYFGSYDLGSAYSRTNVFINELRAAGYAVSICHADLWVGSEEKISVSSTFALKGVLKFLKAQFTLLLKFYREHRSADVLFVGTAGYQDLPVAYLLSRLYSKVLVFDAFYSVYDTIVLDRKLIRENTLISVIIQKLEKVLCRLPDAIILDTRQNTEFMKTEFDIKSPIYAVPPGVPDEFKYENNEDNSGLQADEKEKINCVFYGSYVPLQGADIILRAAILLKNNTNIHFTMIGSGQQHKMCTEIASENNLENVTFKPWMSLHNLSEEVKDADVCLGIFGRTDKALRVVPYKVYSYMAARKPIITMRSPAVCEILEDQVGALLCNSNDAEELANCIVRLKNDHQLRAAISENAYRNYLEKASNPVIRNRLRQIISETFKGKNKRHQLR